jgi:hypothetical protein
VAVVAAVLVLLAGCSGPDGTAGEGDAGSDPEAVSTSPPASPSTSETETETETDAPPTVAAATGASLQVDGVRLRAPLAFSSVPDRFRFRQAAFVPFTNTSVSVFRFPNLADFTVDELADATLEDGGFTRGRRLDDEVIDDQPVYHLAGAIERGGHGETFGTVLGDSELSITFEFRAGEPTAYRDDVIAAVLETVDFGDRSVTSPEAGAVAPPPARGPRIKIPGASLRAPMYWVATDLPGATFDGAFRTGVLGTSIVLSTAPRGDVADLDQLGEQSRRDQGWRTPATRLEDTEVDGQPAVHVAGRVKPGTYVERFAVLVDGQRLTVTFTFADGESVEFRDDAVASVLPTIELPG